MNDFQYWDYENDKIDLVYLWVDGNDLNWQRKKQAVLNEMEIFEKEANCPCRFIDNQELKYSLRSVEKYAPWINKIYIVTDEQVPEWLNLNHPKIRIVDHKEILPQQALPTFNSQAIETALCNIPNLSEFFIYACDDCFIGAEIGPEFFFNDKKFPICRFGKPLSKNKQKNNLHQISIRNAQKLIREKFDEEFNYGMCHNMDLYCKSHIKNCNEIFSDEIKQTQLSKMRATNCISRIIYSYFSCVIDEAEIKICRKIDTNLPLYLQIYKFLKRQYEKDAILIRPEKNNYQQMIDKFHPKLFCLNDNEQVTDKDRVSAKKFLESYFPDKSTFEK